VYLRRNGQLTIASVVLSSVAMVLAMAGTLYPVPASPYNWLPYIYVAYSLGGLLWIVGWKRISAR
jgi:hypothetical protein